MGTQRRQAFLLRRPGNGQTKVRKRLEKSQIRLNYCAEVKFNGILDFRKNVED